MTTATYRGFTVRAAAPFYDQDCCVVNECLPDQYRLLKLSRTTERIFAVDVGAHIGASAHTIRAAYPNAEVICVEANLANVPLLQANTAEFARVIHAACYYGAGDGEPVLLNSVMDGGTATGGSIVVGRKRVAHHHAFEPNPHLYWLDETPLPTVTLEEVMWHHGRDRIDLLKLDCEGSEFDILQEAAVERVGMIVGEYHDEDRWHRFLAERFASWSYSVWHRAGNLGIFHLRNPDWCSLPPASA